MVEQGFKQRRSDPDHACIHYAVVPAEAGSVAIH